MRLLSIAALFALTLSLSAADWPQWRGPERDGHLARDRSPPGVAGRRPEGAMDSGRTSARATRRRSLSAARSSCRRRRTRKSSPSASTSRPARTVWKTPIGSVGVNRGLPYPGTRSSPTVDGDRIYCLASDGKLNCLTTDGQAKWTKDLVKDLGGVVGTEKMTWAYSESVLVDGDLVICTPGGKEAALAALNKLTGKVVWKCELPDADAAEYSSIMRD